MFSTIIFLVSLIGISSQQSLGDVETREYVCGKNLEISSKSECRLRFAEVEDELSAINDNGCFMHFDASRNEPLELCPLQCHKHTQASILKVSSQAETRSCAPGEGVGVERRQSDWFMWRSTACQAINSQIEFECRYVPLVPEEEYSAENENRIEETSTDIEVEDETENEPEAEIGEEKDLTLRIDPTENVLEISTTTTTPITPKTTPTTPKPQISEMEDNLPERVDTLLGFMFPSYRKKIKAQ